jgi:hypothetical protein
MRLLLCSSLVLSLAILSPGAAAQSGGAIGSPPDPIDFTPAHVPVNSPFTYSEYWILSTLLLDLHWSPQWTLARDALTQVLFHPVSDSPTYDILTDWRPTLQSLHMARAVEFSGQVLLHRMHDTVSGGPDAMAPGTLGRLRVYNNFDIFFHVGPDWIPSPGQRPRPFLTLWISDPYDLYGALDLAFGAPVPTLAYHDFQILRDLHDYARDHGSAVITVSHSHPDHWSHAIFRESIPHASAIARHGAGREPILLVPDDVFAYVQSMIPGISPGFTHLTEAQPYVAPVPGTNTAFRVERISSFQDLNGDGIQNFGDPPLNGLRVVFPGGTELAALSEGTFLDLPTLQSYFPNGRPDYLLGTGSHTAPEVLDWFFDQEHGGSDAVAFIPSGYHNFHIAVAWAPFPDSDPNATLPGFLQYYAGG